MPRKYCAREAPVPGSSVSETHPGFWADYIKKEQKCRQRWYNDYGHFYCERPVGFQQGKPHYGSFFDPVPPIRMKGPYVEEHVASPCQPVAYLNACIQEKARRGNVAENTVRVGDPTLRYRCEPAKIKCKTPQAEIPICPASYSTITSAMAPKCNPVGHRRLSSTYTGSDRQKIPLCEHIRPYAANPLQEMSPATPSDTDWFPLTPDGRADLDKMAQRLDGCTWAEVQRRVKQLFSPEPCGCCHVRCLCVDHNRPTAAQSLQKHKPTISPRARNLSEQVHSHAIHAGMRLGNRPEVLPLVHSPGKGLCGRLPMNHPICGEKKGVGYCYDKAQLCREDSVPCGGHYTAREAGHGPWAVKQFRNGRPFPTGCAQYQ